MQHRSGNDKTSSLKFNRGKKPKKSNSQTKEFKESIDLSASLHYPEIYWRRLNNPFTKPGKNNNVTRSKVIGISLFDSLSGSGEEVINYMTFSMKFGKHLGDETLYVL